MKQFFNFNSFVTPHLLKVLYILLQLVVFYQAYIVMFGFFGFSSFGFLYGLVILLFGSIAARVICELIMILFRINDNLDKIRKEKQ